MKINLLDKSIELFCEDGIAYELKLFLKDSSRIKEYSISLNEHCYQIMIKLDALSSKKIFIQEFCDDLSYKDFCSVSFHDSSCDFITAFQTENVLKGFWCKIYFM